jgi:hypothetical protein
VFVGLFQDLIRSIDAFSWRILIPLAIINIIITGIVILRAEIATYLGFFYRKSPSPDRKSFIVFLNNKD